MQLWLYCFINHLSWTFFFVILVSAKFSNLVFSNCQPFSSTEIRPLKNTFCSFDPIYIEPNVFKSNSFAPLPPFGLFLGFSGLRSFSVSRQLIG